MAPRFDRLLVCLPDDTAAVWPFLAEAARFIRSLPSVAVEVVAAPRHEMHGERRHVVGAALGCDVQVTHLVPSARDTLAGALALASDTSLVVADPSTRRRSPRPPSAPLLTLGATRAAGSVIAVVDPTCDSRAGIAVAIDLAERMAISHVVATHVHFDEAAIACDEWEQERHDERTERMDIFLARVPCSDTVTITPCVVQSPYLARTLQRLATDHGAAIVVGADCEPLSCSVLSLPDAMLRPAAPATGLRGLWDGLLDRMAASTDRATASQVPFSDAIGA